MEWISVKKKLPPVSIGKWSKPVIALTKEGNVYKLSHMGGQWQRSRAFVLEGNTEVTHWMPLNYPK